MIAHISRVLPPDQMWRLPPCALLISGFAILGDFVRLQLVFVLLRSRSIERLLHLVVRQFQTYCEYLADALPGVCLWIVFIRSLGRHFLAE